VVEYLGKCLCGQVKLTLFSKIAAEDFRPRSDAQFCEFCRAHDGVWISDPKGSISLRARDLTRVERFASGQVQFHFCAVCGTLEYALFEDAAAPRKRVAVARLALFDAIPRRNLPVDEFNFESETLEAAGIRRLKYWTPIRPRTKRLPLENNAAFRLGFYPSCDPV
jgi:hypothetical protein